MFNLSFCSYVFVSYLLFFCSYVENTIFSVLVLQNWVQSYTFSDNEPNVSAFFGHKKSRT